MPSQAVRELEHEKGHLVSRILYLRAFEGAYRTVRARDESASKGRKPDPLPRTEMVELVEELDLAAAMARINARRGEQ